MRANLVGLHLSCTPPMGSGEELLTSDWPTAEFEQPLTKRSGRWCRKRTPCGCGGTIRVTGPCLCRPPGSPVDESPPPTSSEPAGSELAAAKAILVEPGRVELAQGRRRFRRPRRWSLLAIVVLALFAVYVLPTPWALHIGDRFTPLETWDGFGPVRASNGGHYVLFVHLRGGIAGGGYASPCGVHSCDTLHGNAKLCATNGATYSMTLNGDVHAWWSTDGASTLIELTGRPLPGGWVVAFRGRWNGSALPLADTDNSFTELFTRAGRIRHVTSTADAGTAHVRLQHGSTGAFDRACRALAAGRSA